MDDDAAADSGVDAFAELRTEQRREHAADGAADVAPRWLVAARLGRLSSPGDERLLVDADVAETAEWVAVGVRAAGCAGDAASRRQHVDGLRRIGGGRERRKRRRRRVLGR